jgi:hypothetical protein
VKNLPLSIIKHLHEDVWENGGIAPRILNLGARLREWPALRPFCFIPVERPHGTHWLEKAGCVPQLVWTQCTRSKPYSSCPCRILDTVPTGLFKVKSPVLPRIANVGNFIQVRVFTSPIKYSFCAPVCFTAIILTHGTEPFLRSCQLCSYSRTSQHFMEP